MAADDRIQRRTEALGCEIASKLAPLDVISEICWNIIIGQMVQCPWANRDPSLQSAHDWHRNLRFGIRRETAITNPSYKSSKL